MNEETSTTATTEADDWDDIDLSGLADVPEAQADAAADDAQGEGEGAPAGTEEADQQESGEAAEPGEAGTEAVEKAEADHSLTLKYMGEEKTVSREEAVALAQKGMDYDRVKAKLDERSEADTKNASAVARMTDLAQRQGLTLDEFLDNTHAALLSKKEGLDMAAALGRVRFERRERELAEREAKLSEKQSAQAQADTAAEKRRQDIQDFMRAYPDVNPQKIPKEVWDDVAKGMSLSAGYTKYENARLKAELEAEKKARLGAARAAGSRESAGKAQKTDPYDEGWYDND